jgi:photosystem II stability/assembly factor-like uncharacterized protein
MTDDLIEQLRARNPAPPPLAPPPIDQVLARIAAGERPTASRWPGWVVPSLAVAVAATVAVFAVASIGGSRHANLPVGRHSKLLVAKSLAGVAMQGSLHTSVLAFGAAGTGVIAWTQYRKPGSAHPTAWLATTTDRGRSWSVQRRSYSLYASPVFDGSRNAWTSAVDAHGALRLFSSHDGGLNWAPTQSAGATEGASGRCRWVVMRGPASGNQLPATANQPLPATNQSGLTVSAASATNAYVSAPTRLGSDIYITHDGGRSWETIGAGCGDGRTTVDATVTGAALWRVCNRGHNFDVLRTTNGGDSWDDARLPFDLGNTFDPITAQVAWAAAADGTIYRTANGGASWQPVFRTGGPHGRSTPGVGPVLSAQNAKDASILVQLRDGPHSTNLIIYRTTDAGRFWPPTVVKLPRG